MKTKFYFRLITLAMLGMCLVNLTAEAQPKGNSDRNHTKHEKAYKKAERYNSGYEASAYRYDDHKDHPSYRYYDYDRHGNGKKIYKRHDDDRYYLHKMDTYHHPRYGTVYRSFSSVPVRLRCDHGYYYFHGGHYYQLYPNVGYVRVEIPRAVVFYEIPSHAVRIRIGDQRYYRYGGLVFERYHHGYRLAPPSVMINIQL